jgi:DNA-binding NarL/FixJ family response regulator
MPEPRGLRSQDVRDANRLIEECRDLGKEPSSWHRHLLRGVARLFGILLVAGGEGLVAGAGAIEPISVYGESDDSAALDLLAAYHREGGPAGDPLFRALAELRYPGITQTRRGLVPDAVWYRSTSFEQFRRPAGIDQKAISIVHLSEHAISVIALHGALGERELTTRQLTLLEFVHTQVRRMIGGPLVSDTEPGPERLSPRLRQTLGFLLEGDSEKQVAARLGLSHATVHQYVTTLHRHFGVGSRAQLLAHVMKRLPREPWLALRAGLGGGPFVRDPEPDPERLTPRLRQTLGCLLEGDSEKQVAARLGLSHATVHQYVTTLYRHFGVRSRAQLLAHVMQHPSARPWTRGTGVARFAG